MTSRIEGMPSTLQIVDPQSGQIRAEWYDFLEEIFFGSSERSLGTLLSGVTSVTAKADGLIAGTQVVADVLIDGRGSLASEQDAQTGNIDAAASAGDLTASASPVSALGFSAGSGSKTTNGITVTPAGGVGPYSYAWAKVSGDDVPADSASAATTTFTSSVTLSEFKSAVYRCTVTDSTGGTPLTTTVDVPVNIGDTSGGLIGAA
jgi:hypothetical protein